MTVSASRTATYSPDDNKLRLYAATRLSADEYARVNAAGFRWAPKQDLFVAPSWTPAREDLLLDLCGDIGDDDASLLDRASERAERFEDYQDKRLEDAARTCAAVETLADGIPLGQPILVGHHSEARARRDAERIRNGALKAVQLWRTSEYWKRRAAGSLRYAKYKERPDVRVRRIKAIEADRRKIARELAVSDACVALWNQLDHSYKDGRPCDDALRRTRADHIADRDHGYYAAQHTHPSGYVGPCSYRDALKEPSITPAMVRDKALADHANRKTTGERWREHYDHRLAYERAMLAEAGGTGADQTGAQVGGACRCWASPRGGWSYIRKVNRISVTVLDNWGNGGANFARTIPFDKLAAVMTPKAVEAARTSGALRETEDRTGFYLLSDAPPARPVAPDPPAADFEALAQCARGGITVISTPQLFPTPVALAQRVVRLADPQRGHCILEPSAGTGRLIDACARSIWEWSGRLVAIELQVSLAAGLRAKYRPEHVDVQHRDFLEVAPDPVFDRIVMNPPFTHAVDVQHILHARRFLKPGGTLVAICAGGPKQKAVLASVARDWIDLPAGSFASEGTRVETVIVMLDAV